MICTISAIYNQGRKVPISGGVVDAVFINDESDLLSLSVREAMDATVLKVSTALHGNFVLGRESVILTSKVPVKQDSGNSHSVRSIKGRPTIWALLRMLASNTTFLVLEDGLQVPLNRVRASRTTNSVYTQYQNLDGEFRSEKLATIFGRLDKKVRVYAGPALNEEICRVWTQGVSIDDGLLIINVDEVPRIGLSYKDFMAFISPAVILSQQRVCEIDRICLLAGWFASRFFDVCNGIIPDEPVQGQERETPKAEKTIMPFEVTSNCIKRAELKGLLYGVQSQILIEQLKGAGRDAGKLSEVLSDMIPERDGLDKVFIHEAAMLISQGRDAIAEYMDEQYLEFACQSLIMQEIRAMMVEYDYLPTELSNGMMIAGTKVRVRTGGV